MTTARLFVALAVAVLAACATTPPDNPWRKTYLDDLTAARDAIAANHPGYVDEQNPAFRGTMQSAWNDAQRDARQVVDYDSYRVALTRFVNRFQDAHLSISFNKPFETPRYAGIRLKRRGNAFVADEIDARYGTEAEALRGAALVSCGGEPARAHFEKRVLSWRGRPAIEADWHQLAPILFVDYGPPSPKAPSRCRFDAAGKPVDLALQWTDTNAEALTKLFARTDRGRTLSIEELPDGVLWVNLPTFSVNDEPSIARMNGLIADFRNAMARDWRVVVFDLRGNGGGSESWGRQLAIALFGEEWVSATRNWMGDPVYTDWRVSPDNVAATEGHIRQSEERHGKDSEQARGSRRFHQEMADALARGDQLHQSGTTGTGVPKPAPVPLKSRVVVVTTPECFSACLDFLDLMLAHPKVVQAGEVTGVDTVYMESWGKPLPSGNGRINYPMKVYRNRRRGNNEAYVPVARYPGDLDDTAALRQWVLGVSEVARPQP